MVFERVGALDLEANNVWCAVIDPAAGYAYFGMFTYPGRIVKVRLSDFTRVGALDFAPGENELYAAVIDPAAGYAYFGTFTYPGIAVKIGIGAAPPVTAIKRILGEGIFSSRLAKKTLGRA